MADGWMDGWMSWGRHVSHTTTAHQTYVPIVVSNITHHTSYIQVRSLYASHIAHVTCQLAAMNLATLA